MSTPQPPAAEPQGAWVREVVRDLATEPDEAASPEPHPTPPTPPPPEPQRSADTNTQAPARLLAPTTTVDHGVVPRPVQPSAPAAEFDDTDVSSRLRHGEIWTHRAVRWIRSNLRAGQEDARLVELLEAVRRPVTTGRRIAVTGVRGGVGTTTVALLMASVLANRRDDPILAVDADQEFSTLLWRARPELVSPEPDRESDPSAQTGGLDQLEALVPRTPQGLWMLPAPATDFAEGRRSAGSASGTDQAVPPGLPREFGLYREFGRFFGVTVFDCGSGLTGPRTQTQGRAGSSAHAAVLVAAATVDGVRAAHQTLTGLQSRTDQPHEPLAHLMVALVSRTPSTEGLDVRAAVRSLEEFGPSVVHLPYDRHLAAGARVDLTRLAEPTLLAATDLAGRVLGLARQRDDRTAETP